MVSTRSNNISSSTTTTTAVVKSSTGKKSVKKKTFTPATASTTVGGGAGARNGGGGNGGGNDLEWEEEEEDPEKSMTSDTIEEEGEEEEAASEVLEESEPKKKIKARSKKPTIIVLTTGKKKSEEKDKATTTMDSSSAEEENEEDDSEDDEVSDAESEGFDVPENVEKDPVLLEKFEKVKKDITDDLPTMENILTTPMRKRNRKILFEWYHIYQNLMPCSQDRMEARMMIKNLYDEYKRDFKKFLKHKDEIKAFEKVDKAENSILNMEYDIIQLPTSNENKMAVYRKYKEMREKSEDERDEEYYKLKQWLQWALRIPYDRTKEFPVLRTDTVALTGFLSKLRLELDRTLYGMADVKDQILLFVHHKLVHPDMKGCSLGLVGDPGVGKTSIARCLARVMDFPFEQISFGGIRTTEHLKGFDYTYVGSQPGEIVKCLSRMKYKNGILFLDEYEKVSDNNDINAFLLHLTDFSQNSSFRDNYLCDVSIDLSCLWLIYSMNQLPEDKALRDRIFTIKVSGYSLQDKIHIVRNFIFPVHIRAQSIPDDSIQIDSETASYLIQAVGGNEKGIRSLEQAVKDLVFKITFLVTHGESLQVGFKYSKVLEYPVTITRDLIDVLRKKNTSAHETSYLSMYT